MEDGAARRAAGTVGLLGCALVQFPPGKHPHAIRHIAGAIFEASVLAKRCCTPRCTRAGRGCKSDAPGSVRICADASYTGSRCHRSWAGRSEWPAWSSRNGTYLLLEYSEPWTARCVQPAQPSVTKLRHFHPVVVTYLMAEWGKKQQKLSLVKVPQMLLGTIPLGSLYIGCCGGHVQAGNAICSV